MEFGDGDHGAEDRGAATFIEDHVFHIGGGLDGDATRVKGDGLADEDNGGFVFGAAAMFEDD